MAIEERIESARRAADGVLARATLVIEGALAGRRDSWTTAGLPHRMTVLAMIDTRQVSGPCRGLFQLIKLARPEGVRIIPAMFVARGTGVPPAVEEAQRRGFPVALFDQSRRYDPGLIPQAWRAVHSHGVTILQSHGYKPACLAWCLKRLTGLPWVAFSHGYTSEDRRMAVYNRLDRWLMRKADRVVVMSEAMHTLFERAGVEPGRIRVIHNAVDPTDYESAAQGEEGERFRRACGARPEHLLVGVIGRLSPEKGQARFLEAFRRVIDRVPNARAVTVGEGPEAERLQAQAAGLGLNDHVRFLGYRTDMAAVYAGLDLLVIPSLSEGLPNVLLEALLHRKAVVATRVGAVPDVLQGPLGRWTVPPGDSVALAAAMTHALEDQAGRDEMGAAGGRLVRDVFSPEQRVERIVRLYDEVSAPAQARLRVLSNVPSLERFDRPGGFGAIRHRAIRPSKSRVGTVLELMKTALRSYRYDAILFDCAAFETLVMCALLSVLPGNRCLLLTADLVLRLPTNRRQAAAVFFKRLLLRRVSRFVLFHRDVAGYRRYFGVEPGRVTYVPFKVNSPEIIARYVPMEGDYIFSGGVSLRDWTTLAEAMRGLPIPLRIVAPAGGEIERARDLFEAGTQVVHDDGSPDSWIRWIAGSKFVVLPIAPESFAASGISTYLCAMALKKCVIITDGPATRGILEDGVNSVIVPPRDPAALREAIRRVNEDDDWRRGIAEAGYAYATDCGDAGRLYRDYVRCIREAVNLGATETFGRLP